MQPERADMSEFTFKVEMTEGQPQRQVDADSFAHQDEWLIFYRKGEEYWRASTAKVVSMETKLGDDGELVERMNRAWRHFYNTVENPPENLVRKLIDAVLSRSGGTKMGPPSRASGGGEATRDGPL